MKRLLFNICAIFLISTTCTASNLTDFLGVSGTPTPVLPGDLAATNSATDNYIASYDLATGNFTWVPDAGGAETNTLETTITGILDGEVFIGDGADSGTFTVFSGVISLTNAGLTAIVDGSIIEPDLDTDVAAVDGDFLQYDSTGTNFTWRSGSETLSDIGGQATVTDGNALTFTGATLDFDGGAIPSGDLGGTWASPTVTGVQANSVALTTDTTGNYAAGDGEAGAALTGDSATSFFSSGTIEDARLPTSMADKVITGSFELPNGAAPVVNTAGETAMDTTITDHKGMLTYYDGVTEMIIPAIPVADLTTVDGHIIDYNAAGNKFTMDAPVAGGAAPTDATYITQTADGTLSAEQAIGDLASGIMRVATTTGVVTALTDSAGMIANIDDETGSGLLVFGTAPSFITSITMGAATLDETELEILDGALLSTTELNLLNGLTVLSGSNTGDNTVATSGDSATSFFSSGAIDNVRLNLTAGRSLTESTNDILADAELYTDVKTLFLEDPTAADDLTTLWVAPLACTITKIHCESDQTVTFDLEIDSGSIDAVNGSDIVCTTFATDSSLAGTTAMAAGDRMDLRVTSVSGTPTWFSVSWELTFDD
jgi:hypothetical protein